MTPKPFGSYSESEWYLHMLIRGKDKNINYQPMSFFRTKMSKQRLEEYMAGGKIEAKEALTISPSTEEEPMIIENGTETLLEIKSNMTEVITEENTSESGSEVESEETTIVAELETSVEITQVENSTDEIPQLPAMDADLPEERKQEFLGLANETESEEEKGLNDNMTNDTINNPE